MANLPANPGEAMWIGDDAGKNHFNVGIGLGTSGGQNHEDFGQDLIEEGFVYSIAGGTSPYNDADKFYLNSDGNCVFRINAGAGRTSTNTAHPRSELRELTAGGSQAAWDGRTGTHYMKGRCRITAVTSNRPWVCFGQIHGSSNSPNTSDLIRLQTEGSTGTSTNLEIVARRTPPGGSEIRTVLRTGYDVNDWFSYELGMYDGRLKVFLDGVVVLDVTGMGQIGDYFKAGCYLQDNVEKGAGASEFASVEYERGSFQVWHTGYPPPTAPVFTGASDPGGGPGGGDGTPDTQAPTVPQDLVSVQDDQQITLRWSESSDNVAVTQYNVYRFSDAGGGGTGEGSTATVGKTTAGASTTSSSTDKMAASSATATADGTLTTGFWRARLDSAGTTNTKMFVYADSGGAPGALLATSDQVAITQTTETTQEYAFSGAEQISITDGTTYWIAAAWDDPGTPSVVYSRDTTAGGRVEQTLTYPSAPDPFGTPTGTFTGPIDAWLETVSAGTGGGTDTTLGKTTDGASNSASSTDKIAVSSATATDDGTLTAGHARVWLSATGSVGTRMVVFADSAGAPGNCLAVSTEVTVTATAEDEVDYVFTGTNQIAIANGTTYWVGVAWDDPGTPSLTISRDATAAQRQETTVFTYPPTVGAAFGTPSAQTGPIDAYVEVTGTAGYVLIGTTTGTSYTDTGLTNGTEYSYVVSAQDAAGNESNQSEAVTDTPGPPDTTAPTVPANLNATAGDRQVSLTWDASTDSDSGVDYYVIYRDSVGVETTVDTSFIDTNLSNGTLYTYTVSAVDVAGNESAASSSDTATPTAPAIGGVPFLIHELGNDAAIALEVAWGADLSADPTTWTWTDISDDVRQKAGISTSLGRNDESSTSNPAQLSVVLDNTTGDYSLGGRSANYPYVRRNTPVRLRIDPDDGGGGRVVFHGGADGWTPSWESQGNIPIVTLSASGTLRRLTQGDAPVTSALRRALTAASTVVAYWPLEEGRSADYAPPVRGGNDMLVIGTPDWDSDDSFNCSAKLPRMKDSVMQADVFPYTASNETQIRFLLLLPDNVEAVPFGCTLMSIFTTGTIGRWDITYGIVGQTSPTIGLHRYLADGTFHSRTASSFPSSGGVLGTPSRFSLELTQNGSDIDWRLGRIVAESGNAASFVGETITGHTVGLVSKIRLAEGQNAFDTVIGHVTVENDITSLFTSTDALIAFEGEVASSSSTNPFVSRIERLCDENGVALTRFTSSIAGTTDRLAAFDRMGPQLPLPLLTLLHEAEAADQGQLWDGRAHGLSYTTRRRREEGIVRLTIDAGAGQLSSSPDPIDDDQRTRNRVQVQRTHGITVSYEDEAGPLGTEAIGVYDESVTVNNGRDVDVIQHAQWRVALGTVEGYRYPSVTVDLRANPSLAPDVLDVIPGDRIDITNLDDVLDAFTAPTVSLIVEGIAHEIDSQHWRVTFRCSPFEPWAVGRVASETGDTSDMLMRLDTDGSALNSSALAGATSLSVKLDSGATSLWSTNSDDYPLWVQVGGLPVRVTACSGSSSPQTFTVDALAVARSEDMPVKLHEPRRVGMGQTP